MSQKKRTFSLFYDQNDASWNRKLVIILIAWYIIGIFFFFMFGFFEGLQPVISEMILSGWFVLTYCLFRSCHQSEFLEKNFKWFYLVGIFGLSFVEETLIYYNGGGLQGAATSLYHDLILAIPPFMGIGIGIFLVDIKRKLNPAEIFLIAWIQGFIIEFLFSPLLGVFFLIGGSGAGIYGMMMTALARYHENNEKHVKTILLDLLIATIACTLFMILGAIVGDTIYNA